MPTGAPSSPLPRTLGKRYRLDSLLGTGGMSKVFAGVDLEQGNEVAVKVLLPAPAGQGGAMERFLREARHTASLQHPNVVRVFDLGLTQQDEPYLVMERLDGEMLSERVKRLGRLPPHEVIEFGLQICAGLQAAHEAGIIHRDIKPANVMLVPRPGLSPQVKLLDFGIAKAVDRDTQLTAVGMLVGTLAYMAPEQILGRDLDARADVYSLGALLYRLLTGTAPFQGDPTKLLYHHVHTAPAPLAERAPGVTVSAALERVVMRCLGKEPEERFESMRAVAAALALATDDPAEDMVPTRLIMPGLSTEPMLKPVPRRRCSTCEADNPIKASTCSRCGARLATGKSAQAPVPPARAEAPLSTGLEGLSDATHRMTKDRSGLAVLASPLLWVPRGAWWTLLALAGAVTALGRGADLIGPSGLRAGAAVALLAGLGLIAHLLTAPSGER